MSEEKKTTWDRIENVLSEVDKGVYTEFLNQANTFLGGCERLERTAIALVLHDLKSKLYFEFSDKEVGS